MPISLNKIEDMLASKGFVARNYFTLDEYCIYIEVYSITDANTFMLYISSRYELKVSNRENIYKLLYMEFTDEGDIASEYAEELDKIDISQYYNDFDLNVAMKQYHVDMEQRLKDNYQHELLKDIKRKDKKNLRDLYRQLKRFMYCVQNMRYKLSIFYKNYFCSITKDDELDAFLIYNFPIQDEHKLYIYIDLKTFFEKLDFIVEDIKDIKTGIHRLLDQNQMKHSKILNEMMESRVTVFQVSAKVAQKKQELNLCCKEYEKLLEQLNANEKATMDKIHESTLKYADYSLKGLHYDMERTHILTNLNNDLAKINVLKKDVINNILKIRWKYETLTLKMDKILFDNSIMIHEISKNFEKFGEI